MPLSCVSLMARGPRRKVSFILISLIYSTDDHDSSFQLVLPLVLPSESQGGKSLARLSHSEGVTMNWTRYQFVVGSQMDGNVIWISK